MAKAEGDEALKAVARELREDVHEPAFIGRPRRGRVRGGDCRGADFDKGLSALAERFRESVMGARYATMAGRSSHYGQHRTDHGEVDGRYAQHHVATGGRGVV